MKIATILLLIFVAFLCANSRIVKRQKGPASKDEKQPQPKGEKISSKNMPPHINPAQVHIPETDPDSSSKESALKRRAFRSPDHSDNFLHQKLQRINDPTLKIENEYIVVFKKNANEETVQAMASHFVTKKRSITVKSTFTKVLKGIAVSMPFDALKEVLDYEEVAYIAENGIVKANELWGLDRIDQRDNPLSNTPYNSPGLQGKGVKIYVVDTGIRYDHEEFDGRATFFFDAFGENGDDCNGHGTHCSGTAAGKSVGVAREAELLSVRVLDCGGSGTHVGVLQGLDAIGSRGTVGVVSMSLGSGFYTPINEAVDHLVKNLGFVVAVAAGNENDDACYYTPSSASEVLTVGSTTYFATRSDFSNVGPCVNILAPGSDIYSSTSTSSNSYESWSGTSMATPHVSGAAAVIWSNNADYTGDDVKNHILDNASCEKINLLPTDTINRLLYLSDGPVDNPETCIPPEIICGCSNTCPWRSDGMCDDGGSCAAYDLCEYGSDCDDCGIRLNECPDDYEPIDHEPKECTDCDFTFCQDYCMYSNNGKCEDGGAGSETDTDNFCVYGTDCTDCGRRIAIPWSYPCEQYCLRDGICKDGGDDSVSDECAYGYDCQDCGSRDPPVSENLDCSSIVNPTDEGSITMPNTDPSTEKPASSTEKPALPIDDPLGAMFYQCDNYCYYNEDGDCDDGGENSDYSACTYGTDFNDCGLRPIKELSLCSEGCRYSADGDCDDAGPESDYKVCDYGTDCKDCGSRKVSPVYCIGDKEYCSDDCISSNNGKCEDGLDGSDSDSCLQGTDCTDCGRSRYLCLF